MQRLAAAACCVPPACASPGTIRRKACSPFLQTEKEAVLEPFLFDSWAGVARILVVGAGAYIVLVAFLRVSGKRTLSKMNAFDLVVTVALGSTLATVLLDRKVPLAEGALAFALLIALQFVITWLSVRSEKVEQFVKATPTALHHDGAYDEQAMRSQRVTREEIGAAMRQSGHADASSVHSVVLETDGAMSVVSSR